MQEKTRYTRRVQLTTAIRDGDVESLADLLDNAEKAHAEYEKTHAEHDVEWPVWYAQWLLCERDSFDAACAISTPVVSGLGCEVAARTLGTTRTALGTGEPNGDPTEGGQYGGYY